MCLYSNSRNDVSRVAQRYGTIAAHTWRRASVLVVFVVVCVHMHSFAGLIRRTLQSPTATLIPLFSSSMLTGCGYPGLLGRKNRSDMCPRWESNLIKRVCVYSNSRNDVPRVAQRYETIAAHTRRRASVLVVYVVFCVFVYSFAGLIRRTPPPTFSDTATTDRHSETTIFQLRAHWVRISWSTGSEKSFEHVPPVGVEPSTSCMLGEHPIH